MREFVDGERRTRDDEGMNMYGNGAEFPEYNLTDEDGDCPLSEERVFCVLCVTQITLNVVV